MYQSALNRSRSDKFILVLDLPNALKNKFDLIQDSNFKIDPLQISIFGSPVSPISVPAVNVPFGGQVHKTSSFSRPEYTPLSVKFLVDNGYRNYWAIWNWINLFNDAEQSSSTANTANRNLNNREDIILHNNFSDYVSYFTIYGLDEFNNKIIAFSYKNAFPTELSEISFSNQDPNEITSTVTFVFNQLSVNLLINNNVVNC